MLLPFPNHDYTTECYEYVLMGQMSALHIVPKESCKSGDALGLGSVSNEHTDNSTLLMVKAGLH